MNAMTRNGAANKATLTRMPTIRRTGMRAAYAARTEATPHD